MRRKIMIAAICLAVLAAVGGGAWWWTVKRPVDTVKQRVLAVLNDPDSAKFGEVVYSKKTDAGCGAVNAKNRMGGYIGFTRFVAYPDGDVRFEPDGDPGAGSTEMRMEATQKKINFLTLAIAACPDK